MKRFILCLAFVLSVYPALHAEALTSAELARASARLKKSAASALASTEGLSEVQLNFKAGPTRWSVAEVMEHIAAAEDALRTLIETQVMKAPARSEPENLPELDELVLKTITDRSHKLQAPEPLVPTNRFGDIAATRKHFSESREKTIAFLNGTKGLRDHAIDSPMGKKLDGFQWILFIAAHSERHTKQIEEVKADPNFPKK